MIIARQTVDGEWVYLAFTGGGTVFKGYSPPIVRAGQAADGSIRSSRARAFEDYDPARLNGVGSCLLQKAQLTPF